MDLLPAVFSLLKELKKINISRIMIAVHINSCRPLPTGEHFWEQNKTGFYCSVHTFVVSPKIKQLSIQGFLSDHFI